MIPKIIHYCWLSNNPLPPDAQECISSWKRQMPDWEIKLWNTANFDVESVPFVARAVAARKWAFAADYIRVYALYTEGGVYLDSDVFVRKPMDFVLVNRAFSAIESYPDLIEKIRQDGIVDENGNKRQKDTCVHGIQIQAAILGSEKGHPFFKDCLDHYQTCGIAFDNNVVPSEDKISPIIMAGIAEKYGFRYLNKEQLLSEGFMLYSSDVFCPQPYLMKKEAVAVHCCSGTWRVAQSGVDRIISNIKIKAKNILAKVGVRNKAIDKLR